MTIENPTDSPCTDSTTVDWNDQGLPICSRFGDIYFSNTNGLEEARHVFLQHNHLPQRWKSLPPQIDGQFVIGETGFGTGLNFLAAWDLWRKLAPERWTLHFISVEKFPLSKADISRALHLWPSIADLAQPLLQAYPLANTRGFHQLPFDNNRVVLTVIVEDANDGLRELLPGDNPCWATSVKGVVQGIDAWFLDGFSPAKNPEMWTDALFSTLGKLSLPGTTAATFSAASGVKCGLHKAGFSVEKVAGFGRKRHMLRATFEGFATTDNAGVDHTDVENSGPPISHRIPWSVNSHTSDRITGHTLSHPRHAIVIGAGLAGCHSAYGLAQRGWQVTLLEREAEIAGGASGNPQGVLYAKLSIKRELFGEFNLLCLLYAQRFYQPYWQLDNSFGEQCGVLQLPHTDNSAQQHRALGRLYEEFPRFLQLLDKTSASLVAGIPLNHGGLLFPNAGWLAPAKVCAALTNHANITTKTYANACYLTQHLTSSGSTGEQHWAVLDQHQQVLARAPVVVVANACDAQQLQQTQHLPLQAVRGQVSYLPANEHSRQLKTVLCAQGYLSPAYAGHHCLGATFGIKDSATDLRSVDHLANIAHLQHLCPELSTSFSGVSTANTQVTNPTSGRAALRCTTPDYLPVVGPVADYQAFLSDYGILRKNANAKIRTPGQYHRGLFVNVGHGSRGLAYTPLCGELLVRQIHSQFLPVPQSLATALHPARFIIRDLIRNKL